VRRLTTLRMGNTKPAFLRWLDDVTLDDRALVGGKAAVLGALQGAGYPVPAGFCITAIAFERYRRLGGLSPPLVEAIRDAYHTLVEDGARVAVRSSGMDEDSPAASFAGQYETQLDVAGEEGLFAAISQCWDAADSARVQSYRTKQGIAGEAALPLLIQRMVPARVSGVLFTTDPLSGARETIIEAAAGLGDDLVAGRITPDRYRVAGDGQMVVELASEGRPLLTQVQCHQLADLGRQVEAILGSPQDIEWALHEGQFALLQARPITALAARPLAASEVWTRANIGEVLPHVVTPLTWSVFRRGLLDRPLSVVDGLDGHGRADTADEGVRLIAGRAYLRLDRLLGRFCWLPAVTPAVMRWVLGVEVPEHVSSFPETGAAHSPSAWIEQGLFVLDAVFGVPALRRHTGGLGSLPPLDLGEGLHQVMELDGELLPGHAEQSLEWVARCFQVHIRCTAYAIGVFGLLSALLRRWLPAQAERLLPALLIGREDLQTAAQGVSLWRLAEQSRRVPALAALLGQESSWPAVSHELAITEGGPEFLAGLEAFLSSNGARAAGEFELRTPRWREDPGFVLTILRGYLRAGDSGDLGRQSERRHRLQQDALAEVETHLRWWQRTLFLRLLHSYSTCVTLRENMKYRLMEGYCLLRRLFVVLGERLWARGIIETTDDVFFLTASEAMALVADDGVPMAAMRQAMQERRNAHALWEQADALFWVLDDHRALIEPHTAASATLAGIACSPGRVQGRARVLKDVTLAGTLQPGEILVAPSTDPGWTPLFLTAAGVVTEIGGFLSHGATVAREYGVPAVVNVRAACAAIQTGDKVTVDGDAGRVFVHRETTVR